MEQLHKRIFLEIYYIIELQFYSGNFQLNMDNLMMLHISDILTISLSVNTSEYICDIRLDKLSMNGSDKNSIEGAITKAFELFTDFMGPKVEKWYLPELSLEKAHVFVENESEDRYIVINTESYVAETYIHSLLFTNKRDLMRYLWDTLS